MKEAIRRGFERSEEHTSELQSPCNLVCRLLLEKKILSFSSSPKLPPYRVSRPSYADHYLLPFTYPPDPLLSHRLDRRRPSCLQTSAQYRAGSSSWTGSKDASENDSITSALVDGVRASGSGCGCDEIMTALGGVTTVAYRHEWSIRSIFFFFFEGAAAPQVLPSPPPPPSPL